MKIKILIIATIVLLSVLSACREITVKTKVNRDGSFVRSITVAGDSTYAFSRSDLPYPVDDSWEIVAKRDTVESSKFIVTYTKTFAEDKELNEEIQKDTGWMKNIDREVEITRRFGFFNSYLRFAHVIRSAVTPNFLDYKDYLTPDDMLYIAGSKALDTPVDSTLSDEAEEKASEFIINSLAAEAEALIKDGIKQVDITGMDPALLDRYHDSIARTISDWDFENIEDSSSYNEIIDLYYRWTGLEELNRLKDIDPPLFKNWEDKMLMLAKIIMMESYTQVVEMPGLITETNSVMLKGNQVSWVMNPMPLLLDGYEMYVESRIVNTWAYVFSGLVILVMIVLIILKALK